MRTNHWKALRIATTFIYSGLVFVVLFIHNERWRRLTEICQVVLVAFLAGGAIAAFITYVIKRKPVPMPAWFARWQSTKEATLRPSSALRQRLYVILSLSLATVSIGCFIWGVSTAINSTNSAVRTVSKKAAITVEKPGIYDLWLAKTGSDAKADRFTMLKGGSQDILRGHATSISAVCQKSGEQFTRVCEFSINESGLYNLVLPEDNGKVRLMLTSSVSDWVIVATITSFLIGFASMLVSAYLFLSNRIQLPMVTRFFARQQSA